MSYSINKIGLYVLSGFYLLYTTRHIQMLFLLLLLSAVLPGRVRLPPRPPQRGHLLAASAQRRVQEPGERTWGAAVSKYRREKLILQQDLSRKTGNCWTIVGQFHKALPSFYAGFDLQHPLPDPPGPDHPLLQQLLHRRPHRREVHLGLLAIPLLQVRTPFFNVAFSNIG